MKIKRLYPIIFFFSLLLLWQTLESFASREAIAKGKTSIEAFIPTPTTIFSTLIDNWQLLLLELSETIWKAGLGIAIGATVALMFALLIYRFPVFRNSIMPLTFAINSFPVIGFSPLIVLLFGQGSVWSIIFVSALISYFPILVSMESAFRDINSQSVMDLMRVINASRWQILKKVIIPNSVPYFFIALKLAFPAAVMGAVIGEWLGANNGIGRLIVLSFYQLKPGLLYASLFSVVIVSCLLIKLISILERRLFFWK